MLALEDIKKLTDYQLEVFKDVFFTKADGEKLEVKIDNIQSSIHRLFKDKLTTDGEVKVLNYRMKQAEDFLDKAAPELGLKYEH